jgi:hypothetical protein
VEFTYVFHIVAGSVALLSGYTALLAGKGMPLHRRAGMVFVYTMLAMTFSGALMTVVGGVALGINLPAALITGYLVATSLITVRASLQERRWLSQVLLLLALGVGMASMVNGFDVMANGPGSAGIPPFPYFLFGVTGILAGLGDVRVLGSGTFPTGSKRLSRHLWRMSFALLIAAMSFFFGQADELPRAMRIPALLAAPVLLVLVAMLYWVWRVGIRGSLRRMRLMTSPG